MRRRHQLWCARREGNKGEYGRLSHACARSEHFYNLPGCRPQPLGYGGQNPQPPLSFRSHVSKPRDAEWVYAVSARFAEFLQAAPRHGLARSRRGRSRGLRSGGRTDRAGKLTSCTVGRVALTMNVWLPQGGTTPHPLAVMVHGGGWEHGDAGPSNRLSLVESGLVGKGFVVASVNYRLAPQYVWPAQIEDVKCAIRYLRASAATYGIDPTRIGVWGGSAGGHLVAMLGTAGPSAGYDVGQYLDQSSAVQAVVDEWGP